MADPASPLPGKCVECGRTGDHKLGCSHRDGRAAVVPMSGPLPTDEDAREKANHEPIQAGDAIALLDSLPTRAVVMDGSGEVWRKLGTGKWDRLDSDGGEPAEISSTVVWQSLPPTVEVLHPAGFRRSVVPTPSDAFREFVDHLGVDANEEHDGDEWWAGYRQAQRDTIRRATASLEASAVSAPPADDYEAGYAEGFHHGASTPAPPTITDEMVERAARVLYEREPVLAPLTARNWDETGRITRSTFGERARTALVAALGGEEKTQ